MGFIRGDYLQKQDIRAAPRLVGIHSEAFSIRYPDIDSVEADRLLHGRLLNGQMLYGLGVSCMAGRLVGKGHWLVFLRWPVVRPLVDGLYRCFARYRHGISKRLFPRQKCHTCHR